ncbi:hypothetical protein [Burkholderia plantarii]|uniref:hypothetical protein n=1 Tax=Burkholderia plantarii TaxID=41899 RepID=UPI000A990612|nr:hypothetical protein [Burkholderia plantarii]
MQVTGLAMKNAGNADGRSKNGMELGEAANEIFAAQRADRAGKPPDTANHHPRAIMSEQIVGYWNGFEENPPLIQDLPAGIDFINLFLVDFAASENDTRLKHEYITTGGYSLDQVQQARQERSGLKVCATIIPPKDGLLWSRHSRSGTIRPQYSHADRPMGTRRGRPRHRARR